ncbi:hypothetical protein UCREL1_7194 [Eutypa lata UCREL1]|uniref:Uncharacterized protein n=1 Tax=Eutypa lata (strain UCR-EL1) TaxID=1287681 RepID=M7SHN1_EUTLA|nr:hypothetical protein UCREL1_7194 [Eutypa lata UCREL1]
MESPHSPQHNQNSPSDQPNHHHHHHVPVPESSSPTTGRKRSGSGGSILSKFPFMRSESKPNNPKESSSRPPSGHHSHDTTTPSSLNNKPQGALSAALSEQKQQKPRRRKGSLRKVALLGRGAARERRELKPLAIDTAAATASATVPSAAHAHDDTQPVPVAAAVAAQQLVESPSSNIEVGSDERYRHHHYNRHHLYDDDDDYEDQDDHDNGLGISSDATTPRPSMDGFAARRVAANLPVLAPTAIPSPPEPESPVTSPTISYTSTTDEEDGLSIAANHRPSPLQLSSLSLSSSQESFFHHSHHHHHHAAPYPSIQRRRSTKHQHQQLLPPKQQSQLQSQRAKSPLSTLPSLAGVGVGVGAGVGAAAAVAASLVDEDHPHPHHQHDYVETERWGWVVLGVTWSVFVVGMGSCLNVWSWAWDVGTTPYAPPELEDDPTLPIVGYYPALAILTCIMAWVWVVVAWIGMKYFRHAKISGD